jgi:acyl dehydratase
MGGHHLVCTLLNGTIGQTIYKRREVTVVEPEPKSAPPPLTLPIGLVLDEVSFDVERGKIREFARATAAADPAHTDRQSAAARGHDDVLATATHVVVAGHHRDQRAFVSRLGLDIGRIVVGSTAWEYLRPVRAGDALTGVRRVAADETKPGRHGDTMRLVTLETEYTDQLGAVVIRQREVLIERGAA